MRPIEIFPVLNGWIVKCGCQLVVYDSEQALANDFSDWLREPSKTEERIQMDKDRFFQFKKKEGRGRVEDSPPTERTVGCDKQTSEPGPMVGSATLDSLLRAR